MKLTDIETATQLYANELGISFIDLNETLPEDAVLDMVPRSLVKTNTFIPLFIDDDMLLIASADEPTPDGECRPAPCHEPDGGEPARCRRVPPRSEADVP